MFIEKVISTFYVYYLLEGIICLLSKVIQIVMCASIGGYHMLIDKVKQIVMYTSIGVYNMLIEKVIQIVNVYIYWRV